MCQFLIISKPPGDGNYNGVVSNGGVSGDSLCAVDFANDNDRVDQLRAHAGIKLLGPKGPFYIVGGRHNENAFWLPDPYQAHEAGGFFYSATQISLGHVSGFRLRQTTYVPAWNPLLASDLGQPSAYHKEAMWTSRLFVKPNGVVQGGVRIFELRREELDDAPEFYINPFCLLMDPMHGADVWGPPAADVEGDINDLKLVLHSESVKAVMPLFKGSEHDIRWRFLVTLREKLQSKDWTDKNKWPAVFRLLFAPEDSLPDRPPVESVESFFALDLLGGTFVILNHGSGKPLYEWVPPEGMATNGRWLASYFYRRWKGLAADPECCEQAWHADAEEKAKFPITRPAISSSAPYGEVPQNSVAEFLKGEAPEGAFEDVIVTILEGLKRLENAELKWGDFDLRKQSNGTVYRSRLLEDLATKALPASRIVATFPEGAEKFAKDVVYEVQHSRFRGTLLWARELTAACQAPPPDTRLYLDEEAPRRKGYGWWHAWAQWLTTLPHNVKFPFFSKVLRFNDARTPLGKGLLGGGREDEKNFVQAEAVDFNDEPVFW